MATNSEILAQRFSRYDKIIVPLLCLENNTCQRVILDEKTIYEILGKLDHIRKHLIKIADKGGLVLVVQNETGITTYNKDNKHARK